MAVRYGIDIVTLGPYADPRRVVELAVAAEEAGFELVAVWDHLALPGACHRPTRW
ncbi:hypothetical protein BH23CHL7_BH23CHL7_18040 [soil metagenome]